MAQRPADPAAPPSPRCVGVIADDLTGAADTGLQYLGANGEVWVLPGPSPESRVPPGARAVALNTESRHLLPHQAALAVEGACRFLLAQGVRAFYKKIDSTLRGNLVIEVMQALQTLQLELAVVAPAFPQAGRITVGGYQLVDGLPVDASPYARDPLAPARASHLPTLFAAEGGGEVEHLGLKDVMGGAERVATAIVRAIAGRKRVLVVDAARPEDLQAIVRGMALTPFRLLPVGSAGLAQALQPHRLLDVRPAAPRGPVLVGARPPVLLVAGSLNPVTRRQVAHLARDTRVVVLDVPGLLLTGQTAVARAVAAIQPALLAGHDVVLTTGTDDDPGRRGHALGRDLAMGAVQVGERVAAALGETVAELFAGLPPTPLAGLVLAGGETAMAVCRALGSLPLRVVGEPLPAIPVMRAELGEGMPTASLRVVTKSGGFGAHDALAVLVEHLRRDGP